MSDLGGGHARFDELAAGHALHALDPEDERAFAAHLPGCARCQQALAGYAAVTAGLAEGLAAGQADGPPAWLAGRISAAIAREARALPGQDWAPPADSDVASARNGSVREPRVALAPGTGVRHSSGSQGPGRPGPQGRAGWPRRRRLVVLAAGLAAVIALVVGGVIAGRLAAGPGPRPGPACRAASSCHQVALTAPGSAATTARVIVRNRVVWLVPHGLRPDNRSRQIYVLWQITAGRKAVAVGTFDVRGHAARAVRIGTLAIGYHRTRAFAVSLERGRKAPPSPSSPVAAGLVSS